MVFTGEIEEGYKWAAWHSKEEDAPTYDLILFEPRNKEDVEALDLVQLGILLAVRSTSLNDFAETR